MTSNLWERHFFVYPFFKKLSEVLFIICLILFLVKRHVASIRESLSNIQEKIGEAFQGESQPWMRTFIESLKLVVYPFHLCVRIVPRFLLLLGVLVTVLLPAGIIIYIFTLIGSPSTWISENNTVTVLVLDIISLLSGIGVFSYLGKKYWTKIRESLSNIKKKVGEAISGVWLPELDIKESLSVTWQHNFKSILPFMNAIKTDFLNLVLAVFFFCISYFLASPAITATTNFVYVNFKQTITNIWNEAAPQNVIVLNSRNFSPSYLFGKGTQFSLSYASQGNLSTKTGICPEGSHEEWLELFKKAIWECSEEERMKLKIRGFASIAPVTEKGQSEPDSDKVEYI